MNGQTASSVQLLLHYQTPLTNGEVRRIYNAPYTATYSGAAGWYYIYAYATNNYNSNSSYTLCVSTPASGFTAADETGTP